MKVLNRAIANNPNKFNSEIALLQVHSQELACDHSGEVKDAK
jgi:hypothetical protein